MTSGVRPLGGDELEAFRLGRLVAAERAPYFMAALFAVSPVAAPGLGTFAVDGGWRLYLDPGLLVGAGRWDSATVAAVLLHEVGHVLRDHHGRARVLPADDSLAWNLAGDAEINDDLIAGGVPLPEGVVTPGGLGLVDGQFAEVYYAELVGQSLPDDGSVGCGSGAGLPPVPGELPAGVGAGLGQGDELSPADADLVRRRVAVDVRAAEGAKGRGSVPAGLSRWASAVLAPPTVRWERLLRVAVRRAVAERAGRVNYTYRRPARRQCPGIVKPAMRAPAVVVSIVVDTSGSMGQGAIDAALAEVSGVLKSSGVAREHVRVLSCDADAGSPARVRSAGSVQLVGGGGTDMRVGIAAAEAARPAPQVVIVLTDGYTPWPERPTAAALVCAVIGSDPPDTPVWARRVTIPER